MKKTEFSNYKKKWPFESAMEPIVLAKPKIPCSSVQVDEEVHFLLDSQKLRKYTPNSLVKTIDLQKTYSNKNPVAYPIVPVKTTFTNSLLKQPTTSSSNNKILQRKRKNEVCRITKNLPPRKLEKKSQSRSLTTKSAIQRSKSMSCSQLDGVDDQSSDSDIEIVAVKLVKRTNAHQTKQSASSVRINSQNISTNKRQNRCSNGGNDSLKKASPMVPALKPMDSRNYLNRMRWLSSKGTITVTEITPKCVQDTSLSTQDLLKYSNKVTAQGHTSSKIMAQELAIGKLTAQEDIGASPKLSAQLLPVSKIPTQVAKPDSSKKVKVKRELKNLYENLNEIQWTHEAKYKNLLNFPELSRLSERSTGRTRDTGKALRNLTAAKPATLKIAKKQAKLAKMKSKNVTKKNAIKSNIKLDKTNKKSNILGVKDTVKSLQFNKKHNTAAKSHAQKMKPASQKQKMVKASVPQVKSELSVQDSLIQVKSEVPSVKTNVIKIKSELKDSLSTINLETSSKVVKLKSQEAKLHKMTNIAKVKPCTFVKQSESPPSTSSFNGPTTSAFTSNVDPNVLCNLFDPSEILQNYIDKDKDLYNAYQKGSKLRVKIQPLEQTKLWTPEFYEEFRKYFLDQALRRALETHDQDSINSMFHELLESFMTCQKVEGKGVKKKGKEEEALRTSVRQSEGAFRYKEIVVRKHLNYMQVVLVPNEVKQNSLTVEAIKELKDAFLLARKDPNCRAVLLNSSGKYFCTGIDLSPLVGSNKRQVAEELSLAIRDLVMTLGLFTKPVVAAVNGTCMGFGVSLLTLCDVVLASDKATFCLPATRIGYIPEGGITLTLPQVVGSAVASEMFLQGRRLTAEQALQYGLVSEVLWPTKLMNEVVPRLQTIVSHSLQAMEATKTMVRCHLWDKLKSHVDRERRLLVEHWLSAGCQNNIKSLLRTGWLADG